MIFLIIIIVVALSLVQPAQTPWPTCVKPDDVVDVINGRRRSPVHCDPFQDPFVTTTTWHSRSDPPDKNYE